MASCKRIWPIARTHANSPGKCALARRPLGRRVLYDGRVARRQRCRRSRKAAISPVTLNTAVQTLTHTDSCPSLMNPLPSTTIPRNAQIIPLPRSSDTGSQLLPSLRQGTSFFYHPITFLLRVVFGLSCGTTCRPPVAECSEYLASSEEHG